MRRRSNLLRTMFMGSQLSSGGHTRDLQSWSEILSIYLLSLYRSSDLEQDSHNQVLGHAQSTLVRARREILLVYPI